MDMVAWSVSGSRHFGLVRDGNNGSEETGRTIGGKAFVKANGTRGKEPPNPGGGAGRGKWQLDSF